MTITYGPSNMSKEQLSKYAVMDEELAEARKSALRLVFLKQHQVPKADWSNVAAFREKRSQLEVERLKQQGPPGPGIEEEFKSIEMRDGFQSRIKIHKPTSGGGPLIVLVFGGGFIVGNEEQLTPLGRALAKAFGAITVTVSYRLAPEHKFPTAAHDVEDSLIWIAEHAKDLGADPSIGFLLGGVSAGGVWLCVPWIFPLEENHVPAEYKELFISRDEMVDVPVLDKDALTAINAYLSPDESSPLMSPFNSKTPHKGMPPTCVQVAGLDPLRDDGLIYERVLRDYGVKTKLNVWPGVPHAHFAFFPFLGAGKKAMVDIIMGFNWLLGSALNPERICESLSSELDSGAMGA
ncbi:lipase/esterase [Aureobasidium pullulans]|uniref:Lipase/esterase n=1 Tax=Aureobasidium pullulans TaxID=5580 RepID=A0A4S9KBD4_AURPU|nr:lipase/esterase [Aureobasidium pullulans]